MDITNTQTGGTQLYTAFQGQRQLRPIGSVNEASRILLPTEYRTARLVYDPTSNPYGRDRQIDGGAIFDQPAGIL